MRSTAVRKLVAVLLLFTAGSGQLLAEKADLDVEMHLTRHIDSAVFLEVQVFELSEGARIRRPDVLCNLYLTEITREGMMGSLISDANGTAVFPLVNKFRAARDTIQEYKFLVRVANDERFVSKDYEQVFQKAEMLVEYGTMDEKFIKVTLQGFDSSGITMPLKGLLIQHFVEIQGERQPLNGSGSLTNSEGESEYWIQQDIPGDSADGIVLVTEMRSPVYGTILASRSLPWGVSSLSSEGLHDTADESGGEYSHFMVILLLVIPAVLVFSLLGYSLEHWTNSRVNKTEQ